MLALPDSGVTVWPGGLIFDPPATPPPPNRKTAFTNRGPADDGERRQPAVNPIAGGNSGGGIPTFLQGCIHTPDSTCHAAAGLCNDTWRSALNAPLWDFSLFSLS